jgi:hypothetical protein
MKVLIHVRRLLKKIQMQGRREEETGAYWVVREDF